MSIHAAGVLGLVVVFAIGTTRPISLGVLSLVMTFLVGTALVGEPPGPRPPIAQPAATRRTTPGWPARRA